MFPIFNKKRSKQEEKTPEIDLELTASTSQTSELIVSFANHYHSSTTDTESEDGISKESKQKRTRFKTRYSILWESIPELKGWLQKSSDGRFLAFCSACGVPLKASAGKSDLIKHHQTDAHKKNVVSKTIQPSMTTSFKEFSGLKKNAMKAELKIAALIAEHNLPFLLADHLVPMQKKAFPDSHICQCVSCGQKKTASIIKNVLGRQQFEDVSSILSNCKFSVCVDESTDISNTKLLSIVVRVCLKFEAYDFFFGLVKVSAADAMTLYSAITKLFVDANIDYKNNLIGFAADGANVMTGKNNSVATLLKRDCPNLFVVKCICHSFALCSSYACLKLPSFVETMVRDIYNYVQNSPKRIAQFEDIVVLLDDKPKKLLHPSQTRWLSLEKVVERILFLYEPLKIYFAMCFNFDNIDSAESILNYLKNPVTRLYLEFLKFVLPQINKLNKIFQSENPQIHKVHSDIRGIVALFFDNFLKPEYLKFQEVENVDYKDSNNFIELSNLYLGVNIELLLKTTSITSVQLQEFKNNCLAFYIELCDQLLKRFDLKSEHFQALGLLDPEKTVHKTNTSLLRLFCLFPNIAACEDLQALDSEYREIRHLNFFEIFGETLKSISIQDFWRNVCLTKRGDNSMAFPLMSAFISGIFSLPHSSANVERTFSTINLNKTKTRNRLKAETLAGILLTKDYLKLKNVACFDVDITAELSEKLSSSIYF